MESKEQAFKNLLDLKEILNRLGVEFFLDGGTLLGAYRDKDFCADDENDIDLASFAQFQDKIPEIIAAAQEKGFYLHCHWKGDARTPNRSQEIALTRGKHYYQSLGADLTLKIDLYFYEKRGDDAWTGVYDSYNHMVARVVPYKHISPLDKLVFRGTEFNIPNNIEEYLTYSYGDWKTPKHRSGYSCYNPNHLKALKPDYKFYESNS